MDKVIKLENVNQYNELYGLETLHPLISVIDLTKATKTVNHIQMNSVICILKGILPIL